MAAAARHAFCVPLSVENGEFDHAMRTRFHASSLRTEIDRHMVNITGHEAANETPKLARQDIWLAVHRADDITRLQGNPFDLIGIDHVYSVLIIRKNREFVSAGSQPVVETTNLKLIFYL
jgi:hypothetical protein